MEADTSSGAAAESTAVRRPGALSSLPARLSARGLLAGKRFDRATADIEREVPHRVTVLGAALRQVAQLVAGIARHPLCLVGILERGSHRHERSGDDVGDERVLEISDCRVLAAFLGALPTAEPLPFLSCFLSFSFLCFLSFDIGFIPSLAAADAPSYHFLSHVCNVALFQFGDMLWIRKLVSLSTA